MACQYSEQGVPEEAQKPPSKVVKFAEAELAVSADLEEAKEPAQTKKSRAKKAAKSGKAKKKSTARSKASARSSEDEDAAGDALDRELNEAAAEQQEKPAREDSEAEDDKQAAP